MNHDVIEVVKPGLETTVQELPGRIGYWEQGFPPSGPVDTWSFRLANLLVGNHQDTAALECQLLGPSLLFHRDAVIAVTGADMRPTLDGKLVEMWTTVRVKAHQTLALSAARTGVRCYIAVSGGIATQPVLGSRSVFHMAQIGGAALKEGQAVPVGASAEPPGIRPMTVSPEMRPVFPTDRRWTVECVTGPNDDWLAPDFVDEFFVSDWVVQAKSNRTGIRLTGPAFRFSEKATNKKPEHGQDPSNILDHGYPLGAINLAGQTPIILINDAPSTGGFINPFTVPSAAFWKLAHVRPADVLSFRRVTVAEAQDLRRALDAKAERASLRDI